ncbi:MAG TPA: prepilin peptidase [Caulobacteraceae bacterium]|nr:prepilin peptidase [Caulobacteraceae bacterium]
MTLPQAAALALFPALVIVAAVTDIASFTIPNRLTLLLAACYLPAAIMLGRPFGEIGLCLAIGAGALAVAAGMFAAGWIGGGDAKLFASVALWLGWPASAVFLMVTALAGGGLALLLLNARAAWVKPYLAGAPPWLSRLTTTGEAAPYGVAIALGALAAFPQSSLLQGLHLRF